MKNDIKTIEELMKILQNNKLTELFYENSELTITLKGTPTDEEVVYSSQIDVIEDMEEIVEENTKEILSEHIGRYNYLRKDGSAIIEVGKQIKKGDKLGDIVAVGVALPVISNLEGIIEEIYIKNNDAVDYGKPLIKVKI